MKLELKDFQEARVSELLDEAARAQAELAGGGKPQALVLSSPTGSGKTVIATAFMEQIIAGGADGAEPDPEATFLWLSYQPDLNEQTRRKIEETSSLFGGTELVSVDTDFDQETLDPGRIYFLNVQKLGRGKQLVTAGDRRQFTLWDTVRATVEDGKQHFFVVIDEAHKGMLGTNGTNGGQTIMQKFILGSPEEIPEIPMVLAISATPERFEELAGESDRLMRKVTVDPDEVRASGLLKDRVILHHPTEAGPAADATLLEEAARQLQDYRASWAAYTKSERQQPVDPILVVQVEDATKSGGETRTDLSTALDAIERGMGELGEDEIAHSFQERVPIEVAGRTIPYVSPADIQGALGLRVVLFKMSLNTGWDCPRAEVMFSFRRAQDQTHISQLIGRMVRTPLARRIESNEALNSVRLYLPRFNETAVNRIVGYLTDPDPEDQLGTDVEKADELVDLTLVKKKQLVGAYEGLPSYTVHYLKNWPDRRRAMKLARALAQDEIEIKARDRVEGQLVTTLLRALDKRKKTKAFKAALKEKRTLQVQAIEASYGGDESHELSPAALELAAHSIDDVFRLASGRLGDGLAVAAWKKRADSEGDEASTAIKLELACLIDDDRVIDEVEVKAKGLYDRLLSKHRQAIRVLPADRRDVYAEIQRKAKDPEPYDLTLPNLIQVRKSKPERERHLYVDDQDLFPGNLNTWESPVIDEELENDEVVGWLRNVEQKDWALCIPYDYDGRKRSLFPDLVVFRKTKNGLVTDILDPHRSDLDDAWAKAKGLAQYAAKHVGEFGRIEVIIVARKQLHRLDLVNETVRDRVIKVSSNDHLRDLYAST